MTRACAAPGCDNQVPPRVGRVGRPPIYCSPACRPSRQRSRLALTVEVEVDDSEQHPERAGLDWLVCMRRGTDRVVVGRALGRFSAAAVAEELRSFLGLRQEGVASE